jgi:hypothetical protein
MNVFLGNAPNRGMVSSDTSYTMGPSVCGTVTASHKIKPVQKLGTSDWALRYVVPGPGA